MFRFPVQVCVVVTLKIGEGVGMENFLMAGIRLNGGIQIHTYDVRAFMVMEQVQRDEGYRNAQYQKIGNVNFELITHPFRLIIEIQKYKNSILLNLKNRTTDHDNCLGVYYSKG